MIHIFYYGDAMGFDVETPEACQYRIYYRDHMIGENEKLIITNNK